MKQEKFLLIGLVLFLLSGCSEMSLEGVDYHKIKCKANLKMLSVAKVQVELEYNVPEGGKIMADQISRVLGGQFSSIECPNGGTYSLNPVGKNPTCSVHGDLLPPPEKSNIIAPQDIQKK